MAHYALQTRPEHETVTAKADGSFVYTPAKDFAVSTPLRTRSRVSTLAGGTATIVVR